MPKRTRKNGKGSDGFSPSALKKELDRKRSGYTPEDRRDTDVDDTTARPVLKRHTRSELTQPLGDVALKNYRR